MKSSNKIALIGGSGFVGTRLSKRLAEKGHSFSIYDKYLADHVEQGACVDVENPESLLKIQGATTIINLAAVHRDDVYPRSKYDDVNVSGSENVVATAIKLDIKKIIFISSVAIYGFAEPGTGEDGRPNYFNDYGRTKYLAEKVYLNWQSEDPEHRSLVIVRPTVIFGEGNRGNVYNLMSQINSKRFVMIGSGSNKKSMAYVENVVAFLEYSLRYESGVKIFNYVDKPDFDMNSLVRVARKTLFEKDDVGIRLPSIVGLFLGLLADILANITRKKLPVSSIRIRKFLGTTQFSSAAHSTGFTPPVSLEEGLARTLRYEFLEDNSGKPIFETE